MGVYKKDQYHFELDGKKRFIKNDIFILNDLQRDLKTHKKKKKKKRHFQITMIYKSIN